jgi:predicted permease
VVDAGVANALPFEDPQGGYGWSGELEVEGQPVDPRRERARAVHFAVSRGFPAAAGIRLRSGRWFSAEEDERGSEVALVSASLARRSWGTADPLGRRLRRGGAPWLTIVGIVSDIRRDGKTGDMEPQVYLSAAQTALYPVRLSDLAVRTSVEPRSLLPAIQSAVWSLDKDQPVTNVRTLDEIVALSVSQRRFQMLLLALFAGVGLTLSLVGIFGVLAYSVAQRTAEFGVRLALGAPPRTILALVLRQAAALIVAGLAVGVVGAWSLSRYLQSLLFEVRPHDLSTYLLTGALLLVASVLASAIPARRAARVDPLVALRYE